MGRNAQSREVVSIGTQRAINGHLQITGVTGMGKTHMLIELLASAVESASDLRQPFRIHLFDPHGDIDTPHTSTVKFSEATGYGYNPLEVNPDPDYGGVRRSIQKFIAAVKKHKQLGTKQEAVMRYLLEDLYISRGFRPDNPATWVPDDSRLVEAVMGERGRTQRLYLDVSYEHRERFKSLLRELRCPGGFDDFEDFPSLNLRGAWWIDRDRYEGDFLMWEPRHLFKTIPTLDDAVRFTESKLKAQYCGTNSAAIAHLKDVNTAARAYQRRIADAQKKSSSLEEAELAKLEADRDKAKERAVTAYQAYLDAITTGRELDEQIRYSSADVLQSVYERFQNLRAIGIYQPVPPPFDPHKPIWRYLIKPLEIPVQSMFVDMVCSRVFARALQRGVQRDVVELIVLDEGKRYITDDDNDVLNKISNEARKFGLGLWVATQTPAHLPDDFVKATGTIIVIGLANADTSLAARKLGIDESLLRSITPQKTALVQIKNKGELAAKFQLVTLD